MKGLPQGGPLSPLLSNLVLDDLDKELTRRGHRFCRYADDCNIYVRSRRAGERVMASVSRFLTDKAEAQGQRGEKRGGAPGGAEVPGFHHLERRERAAHRAEGPRASSRCEIRELTRRTRGEVCEQIVEDLAPVPDRMARLLRLLPDPACAHEPGSVDTPKTTYVSLAAVEERAQPLQGAAPTWRLEVPRGGRGRFTDGVLAHVQTPVGPTGPAQPCLR